MRVKHGGEGDGVTDEAGDVKGPAPPGAGGARVCLPQTPLPAPPASAPCVGLVRRALGRRQSGRVNLSLRI